MKTQQTKIQTITFLVLFGAVCLLLFFVLKPFLNIIVFALLLAVVFNPMYLWFKKRIKSEGLASLLTVATVIVVLAMIFGIFGKLLYNELNDFYDSVRSGELVFSNQLVLDKLPDSLRNSLVSVSQNTGEYLSRFTTNAFNTVSSVLSNLAVFFFNLFLTFFALYYLLKDGSKLRDTLSVLAPISEKRGQALLERLIAGVNGVVKGTFLVALIQGFTALVGMLIFGVPNPILWSGLTVIAAFVPNIGTSLVMIPIILYLLVTGPLWAAIGMLVWASLAVGLIDNVASPKLVGKEAEIHPLIVLLSVLGGLQLFGFLGILFGPIIAVIFLEFFKIYSSDVKDYLD